jgi:hypothetical protein
MGNLESDPGISRRHALFYYSDDGLLLVEDLGARPAISAPPGNSPTDAMVAGRDVRHEHRGRRPVSSIRARDRRTEAGRKLPAAARLLHLPGHARQIQALGLGISANPTRKLVYIGMATVNKIAVYSYDDSGKLTFVRAVNAPGAELPCWTLVNKAGTRLYTANAGNNTMSVFDLTDPTHRPSYSPITVPLGLNINPFGMAVLSR